jgi:hypothetical protein
MRTVLQDPPRTEAVINGITVGNTSTSVLAAATNYKRQYGAFVNDSDETIYIALASVAVMNQGVRLNERGGSWELPKDNEGNVYQGIVTAICSSGSKNLAVTEM